MARVSKSRQSLTPPTVLPPPMPLTPATMLTPGDLDYQRTILLPKMVEVQALQRVAARAMQEYQALLNGWQEHLTKNYQLQQGDQIDNDGRILRVPPPAPGTPPLANNGHDGPARK